MVSVSASSVASQLTADGLPDRLQLRFLQSAGLSALEQITANGLGIVGVVQQSSVGPRVKVVVPASGRYRRHVGFPVRYGSDRDGPAH